MIFKFMGQLFSKRKLLFFSAFLSLVFSSFALLLCLKHSSDFSKKYFDVYSLKNEIKTELVDEKINGKEEIIEDKTASKDKIEEIIEKKEEAIEDKTLPRDKIEEIIKNTNKVENKIKKDNLQKKIEKVKSKNTNKVENKIKKDSFQIQIGVFRDQKFADNVYKKYTKKGYCVSMKKVKEFNYIYISADSKSKAILIQKKEKFKDAIISKVK